jgi:hypothetical protein
MAGKLLWITIALGLFRTAYYVLRYGSALVMTPNFLVVYVLEIAAWITAVVFTLRRNNVARVALFLLVAFVVLNTIRNAWLHPFRVDVQYSLWLIELGLRLWACYLLLRPESNAWFQAASTTGSAIPE